MSGFLFVVLASFLWALDGLIRFPLLGDGLSASSIVFFEHSILSLFFLPYILRNIRRYLDLKFSTILALAFIGIVGSGYSTLAFTEAFKLINPSIVILLQKLQPIVAITLSAVILKERVSLKFVLWSLFCIFGVILLSFESLKGIGNINWQHLMSYKGLNGQLLALTAVLGWGSSTVIGKLISSRGLNEKEIMAGRFFTGWLALIPLAFIMPDVTNVNGDQLQKILIMVFISGLLGMYFYYRGLKKISAKLCTIGELFFPLGAVVFNWSFLGLELTMTQIVGGIVLVIGSSVIQMKKY